MRFFEVEFFEKHRKHFQIRARSRKHAIKLAKEMLNEGFGADLEEVDEITFEVIRK